MNEEKTFNSDELLLHRFLDDELDSLERLAFFEALDRSPELRKQLVAHERLLSEVAHLPRVSASPSLKSDVLSRLAVPTPSVWSRLKERLFRPHTLQWNPAMAFALCALLIGVFLFRSPGPPTQPPEMVTTSATAPPAQAGRVLVRLVYVQPHAKSVAVAGDFNDWQPDPSVFRKTEDGAWTATLEVKPGRYHYMFVVDDKKWVPDPLAHEYSLDGFGSQNAVLDVSGVM